MKASDQSMYTKKQLLAWVNELLKLKTTSLQQLANGAVFCQLLDVISQGNTKISKLNWNAKLQHQNLSNLKMLSTTMLELGIDKKFDAQRISQKKTQDILQLLQWFRKYFLTNSKPCQKYDPEGRRKSVLERQNTSAKNLSLGNKKLPSLASLKSDPNSLSSKRQPEQITINEQKLRNCFKVNNQIVKIVEQNSTSDQKKVKLIRELLLKCQNDKQQKGRTSVIKSQLEKIKIEETYQNSANNRADDAKNNNKQIFKNLDRKSK